MALLITSAPWRKAGLGSFVAAFLATILVQALHLRRHAPWRQPNLEGKRWGLHLRLELGTASQGHSAKRGYNTDADEKKERG